MVVARSMPVVDLIHEQCNFGNWWKMTHEKKPCCVRDQDWRKMVRFQPTGPLFHVIVAEPNHAVCLACQHLKQTPLSEAS